MKIFNAKKEKTSPAKPTNQAPQADDQLDVVSLEEIGGGLNPQPIPPGRQPTFAGESGTGKTNLL